jgi:phosphate transport system permease protein
MSWRYLRRRWFDRVMLGLAWVSLAAALLPLAHMFALVLGHGLSALSLGLFTQVTNGVSGGLAGAILGSLLLIALSAAFSVPIGVLGGVYLSEYGRGPFAAAVRFSADVLAGVPSIVLGFFGYITMVTWLGWGFSALAAAVTLTILMLPYILRATDLAVGQVPQGLKEAALSLGVEDEAVLRHVTLRAAVPGILTGVLLAVSIAVGETAPLIYTAGWSNYLPTVRLTHAPIGYLTYVVWTFINEPFASAHALAYAAALLLMVLVLLLNVAARWAFARPRARA